MFNINYTNTIPEIKRGNSLFMRKYAIPRMMPMTILFLITVVFGIDFIIKNPAGIVGYILAALSAGMLVSLWTRPHFILKRTIAVIETMGEERYIARFYDDRIEIDTEIIEAETEVIAISKEGVTVVENPEILEEVEKQIQTTQPETSVYRHGAEVLYSVEDGEMFCLFVNKAWTIIFPKRCMNEEQVGELQNYFKDKGI
jgi:hypothetical protein